MLKNLLNTVKNKVFENRSLLYALVIAVVTYTTIFFPILFTSKVIGGSDATRFHYPNRAYIYEKLHSGEFPFYTERIFSGFLFYADIERAALNPVNLLSIYFFGPFLSYKILHFIFYIAGSIGLYKFLKSYKINLYGYFVSNLAYFFTGFHLYHQQHFSIVLTTYLIPLNLYLISLFLRKRRYKYLLINSLLIVLCVYFGSIQSIILSLIPQLLYLWVSINKKSFIYIFVMGLFCITLASPALYPAYKMYQMSSRVSETNFTQGSLIPAMAINVFYPSFLGLDSEYKGIMVSDEYQIHETYMYSSLIAIVLAALGYIRMSNFDRVGELKKLLSYLVLIFCVLGFIGYVPVFNSLNIPIVNFFRYWARSVVLLNLAVAIFAGFYVSNLFDLRLIKRNATKGLYYLAGYFSFLTLFNITNERFVMFVKLIFAGAVPFDVNLLLWILIAICSVAIVYFLYKEVLNKKHLRIFICLLVFFDVFVFGYPVARNYIKNINEVDPRLTYVVPESLNNTRILEDENRLGWNLGLYYGSWGIFGYSQFEPSDYVSRIKEAGIKNPKKLLNGSDLSYVTDEYLHSMRSIGVSKLYRAGKSKNIALSSIDVFEPNAYLDSAKYITKKEGEFEIELEVSSNTNIRTYIRNYDGWRLYINGKQENFTIQSDDPNVDDVFLSFNVSSGKNIVKLKYVPVYFYEGLNIFAFLIIVNVLVFSYIRKNYDVYKF